MTILTLGISGCCTTPFVDSDIGLGHPPTLEPMTQEMRDRTDDDVVLWMEETVGEMKLYVKDLRRRIREHDEALE